MICPLMSTAGVDGGEWGCEKSRCAWWTGDIISEGGECAITAIARAKMAEREAAQIEAERERYLEKGEE